VTLNARRSKAKPDTIVCGVGPCGRAIGWICDRRVYLPPTWRIGLGGVWRSGSGRRCRPEGGIMLREIPAEIACSGPKCGQRQWLDPDVLDVAPAMIDEGDDDG
jgi:hypothetical protein